MTDLRARVAYLQGLAEGLDVDAGSAEGRILTSMIEVLSDVADQITEMNEAQDELVEYVEDVDYDLGALEEQFYEGEGQEVTFVPEEAILEEEDGTRIISCPECGEALAAEYGQLEGEIDAICPTCGTLLQGVDLDDYVPERD